MSETDLVRYVLSNPAIGKVKDSRLSELLESGELQIKDRLSDDKFVIFVPSIALLN